MLIAIAVTIMCFVFYQLGVVTVLASVLLLVLKAIFAALVLVAGFFGWRSYRNRNPKQLPGGTYEHNR